MKNGANNVKLLAIWCPVAKSVCAVNTLPGCSEECHTVLAQRESVWVFELRKRGPQKSSELERSEYTDEFIQLKSWVRQVVNVFPY